MTAQKQIAVYQHIPNTRETQRLSVAIRDDTETGGGWVAGIERVSTGQIADTRSDTWVKVLFNQSPLQLPSLTRYT